MVTQPQPESPLNCVLHGDALDVLRGLPDACVDAIVTDPPYGLGAAPDMLDVLRAWLAGEAYTPKARGGFMGKAWDAFVPGPEYWRECLRVLKPGGHALVFAGTRTWDVMGLALRLAGFELRDTVQWVYGSGFPKSLDVGKAIDKRGGNGHLTAEIGHALQQARVKRGISATQADALFCGGTTNWSWFEGRPKGQRAPTPETFAKIAAAWPEVAHLAEMVDEAEREVTGRSDEVLGRKSGIGQHHDYASGTTWNGKAEAYDITAPATDAARQWDGWGTALKPSWEPVILCRKPLAASTVAANVLAHGTGALNIAASRVGSEVRVNRGMTSLGVMHDDGWQPREVQSVTAGRWPPNLLLSHAPSCGPQRCELWCPVRELDRQSGVRKSGGHPEHLNRIKPTSEYRNTCYGEDGERFTHSYADSGGSSRFFPTFRYVAKASRRERNAGMDVRPSGDFHTRLGDGPTQPRANTHPTVKPLALMSWLIGLITPPGGVVLDPFAGSGSTLVAAKAGGWQYLGVEREAEYVAIAQARLAAVTQEPEPSLGSATAIRPNPTAKKPRAARRKPAPDAPLWETTT